MDVVRLALTGSEILSTPLYNKGTAFTQKERDELGLNGLLPIHIATVEAQIKRAYQNLNRRRTPLGKYEFLIAMMNRNEILFYQIIARYAEELLPIIYTPTVAEAALNYSSIYNQQRGLYISYPLKDQMDELFENYPQKEIDVIVVTDGERILGLGDQGIGGMAIPIGKLSLYTLFAGIHPSRTLPIFLDVGTNNPDLLKNPLYLGWKNNRLAGQAYDDFIEQFIAIVKKRYPKVLLQWEDFGKNNARKLLDRYRHQLLSFNDDIQGTAAATLAAILSAIKVAKQTFSEQRIAILGGGSAGTGIGDMLLAALQAEGLTQEEAARRIYMLDIDGLIHFNSHRVDECQRPFIQPQMNLKDWKIPNSEYISLRDVVANARPTVLIGVSAQAGAFSQEIIQQMTSYAERPIVLPLSNPTSKAECTPQELIEWTEGKAIIATGSPFQPVLYKNRTYRIAQCNNVYIFPGVGLGAIASGAREVTEGMFLAAAFALSSYSPALHDPTASLFPAIKEVRGVSRKIALAVAQKALKDNVATVPASEIERRLDALIWEPHYPTMQRMG